METRGQRSDIHVNNLTYCALCNLNWRLANRQISVCMYVTTDAFKHVNMSQSPVSNPDKCGTHRYTMSHSTDAPARTIQVLLLCPWPGEAHS